MLRDRHSEGQTRAIRETTVIRPGSWEPRGAPLLRALLVLGAIGSGTVGCAIGEGWTTPDYQKADPPPRQTAGHVRGLTVLVSFTDEGIEDDQAVALFRMMNEPGFSDDGNMGSVRDYFLDVSGGQLDLETQVVRVRVDHAKSHYDTPDSDRFNADDADSIEDVTIEGQSTNLLNDVLCKLVTCGDQLPDYEVVTATGVSPSQHHDFNFSTLSTRNLAFWPDHYVRTITRNSYLVDHGYRRYIDIPNIELYQYVSLIYAGKTSQTVNGQGLWPRSVPSIGTVVPGASSGVKLGRFQIQGTVAPYQVPSSPTETSVALAIHETAHTLFDLPDLYDSGHEMELDVDIVRSAGVGAHALMGHTNNQKNPPLLSAPMRDRLGWADVIDISDAPEGTLVTIQANSNQTARYCRPHSVTTECYYIEARSRSVPRGPSGFPVETPDEGLVIWHAENTENVLDFVVNNNEEGTPGLHFEVALVQADGAFELESAPGGAQNNDYFRAGHADRFDALTTPRSHWWDGTPSGLAIRNISAPGGTMTFEIGRRPLSHVHVQGDAHVTIDAGDPLLRVGETRAVTVTPDAGYRFDVVIEGHDGIQATGLTGAQTFEVRGSLKDTHVKVTAYPIAQSAPAYSAIRGIRFAMTEGVEIVGFAEQGRTYEPGGRVFDEFDQLVRFLPGNTVALSDLWDDVVYDMQFRTYEGQPATTVVAKAKPGFALRSLDVHGYNHASASTLDAAYAPQVAVPVAVATELVSDTFYARDFEVLARAEPLPGYFCRADVVEPWDPSKVYGNVGDKVRYGDYIYTSNVPRNLIRGNLDGSNRLRSPIPFDPDTATTYWTRFEKCGAYTEDCSSLRHWSLGGSPNAANPATADGSIDFAPGERAQFNGRVYELVGSNPAEVPGAFSSRQDLLASHTYAGIETELPIYDSRVFVYPRSASWRLVGHCNAPEEWQRATVAPSVGVAEVRAVGADAIVHHPEAPVVVQNIQNDWTLEFDLELGFELDDVFVDGAPLGLPASARSALIDDPDDVGEQRPSYIEIRTRCADGACSGGSEPVAPSVGCTLGAPQVWGNGFVYSSVTVTNVGDAPIDGWSIRLEFAAPPSLWGSGNETYVQEGNAVTISNLYAWNGVLSPGQSYSFSVGGNLSGPFVPPVCTGL